MTKIHAGRRPVKGQKALEQALEKGMEALQRTVSQYITLWLDDAVTCLLGRALYVRRHRVSRWLKQELRCPRCGTQMSQRFSRNGSRSRTLHFLDFTLDFRLPRVVCECGGSVCLDWNGLIRPYQRLADEFDVQVARWASMCVSLRQMQRELSHFHIGPVGMSTLLKRLHQFTHLIPQLDAARVPPVLQIDAIWITQLRPNGRVRRDMKGRRRLIKGRFKRPVLIAMGVWPDTGHTEILAWQLGESEDTQTWMDFLTHLEAQGVSAQHGLELIIHDGCGGLCSALKTVYYDVDSQRCLFHKLRNIGRNLSFPAHWSAQHRAQKRRAILKDFRSIWQAKQYRTVLRRYLRTCRKYRHSQPAAVATLRRDFRSTVTYYRMLAQHPSWKPQRLRTTSHLERFNRSLRQHARAASAYHSDDGLLAMIAQQTLSFNQRTRPYRP